ncbi:MAG: hypothetical protein P8181_11940 [bacterium]
MMRREPDRIMSPRWFLALAAFGVAALGLVGCVVPPTASMQSARCMDEKQHRIVPYMTAVERESGVSGGQVTHERIANDYGLLVGIGTKYDSELQIRFDRIQFVDDNDGYNFTSIGPKFGIVEDVFAVVIPFGLYWNGAGVFFDTIQLHPGMIVSLPVDKHLEISTAGKVIVPLSDAASRWYVLNLGLALSSDVDRWAVLPELGVAWGSGGGAGATLFTYGVSLAFYPRSDE